MMYDEVYEPDEGMLLFQRINDALKSIEKRLL